MVRPPVRIGFDKPRRLHEALRSVAQIVAPASRITADTHGVPEVLGAAVRGRLVEIRSPLPTGRLSVAVSCVIHAQADGEPCAWALRARAPLPHPPDLAARGVDLGALLFLLVPQEAGAAGLGRAAEIVLRSGAVGLVVLDLVTAEPHGASHPWPDAPRRATTHAERTADAGELSEGWQSRLAALARRHHSAVLLLTDGGTYTGPLVSLRIAPRRARGCDTRLLVEPRVERDRLGRTKPFEPLESLAPELLP
ncbi:MAG: DNA recombination/repair protein RecA [Myxococcota bacterium]|nr:DNA recombination/repair protein RecA [Myxococcota bacterium]MDW8362068.1 hypothetical protein [Myxococcales bacterium]